MDQIGFEKRRSGREGATYRRPEPPKEMIERSDPLKSIASGVASNKLKKRTATFEFNNDSGGE